MANSEHIKWLLEGVESWNERHQNVPGKGYLFTPDFEGAPLYWTLRDAGKLDGRGRIPLAGADLSDAVLTKADLNLADLSGANLELATLTESKLWQADLTNANLHFAELTGANLTASEPWKADLYPSVIKSPEQHPDKARPVTSIKDLLPKIQRIKDYYDPTISLYLGYPDVQVGRVSRRGPVQEHSGDAAVRQHAGPDEVPLNEHGLRRPRREPPDLVAVPVGREDDAHIGCIIGVV